MKEGNVAERDIDNAQERSKRRTGGWKKGRVNEWK
jgi:hypothetical protein